MRIKQTRDTEAEQLVSKYVEAKRIADLALSQLDQAESELKKYMEANQRKTLRAVDGHGVQHTATYTQRTTTQIDEKGLRKALTARVFDKYTVKKLDRKALETAMDFGDIDPMVVAQYVEQVPGKSYLTYRVKEPVSDEA